MIFNNPERHNAVSLDMWEAAGAILDDFRNDNNIAVVVVTGAGGKAFVSGADISRFEKERSSEEAVAPLQRRGREELRRLPRIPQADHRHDPRLLHRRRHGARHLLRSSHLHRRSKFAVPAAKLGLGYGYPGSSGWSTWSGRRSPWRFSTPRGSSPQPRRWPWGWSTGWCPTASLRSYVKDYADTIAGNAPLTIKAVKAVVSEMMKDESKRDLKRAAGGRRRLLQEPRL